MNINDFLPITDEPISFGIVCIMMFIAFFLATFYTTIIQSYFYKNVWKWFFFIFNPLAVLYTYIVAPRYVGVTFFALFISVFLLAIFGLLLSTIQYSKRGIKPHKERIKQNQSNAFVQMLKSFGNFLFPIMIVILFFATGGALVPLLFLVIPISMLILPSSKKTFRTLQNTLPTSKIGSVAMGLAEIEGETKAISTLKTPLEHKNCIGYYFEIEEVHTDEDGDEHYTTIHTEQKCEPFYMVDNTGEILVQPQFLELHWFDIDVRSYAGSKRYTQYVLYENAKMLLVGQATLGENNEPQMELEPNKNVFVISPSSAVNRFNRYHPLLNQFIVYLSIIGFFASLILMSDVSLQGNRLKVKMPNFGIEKLLKKKETDNYQNKIEETPIEIEDFELEEIIVE